MSDERCENCRFWLLREKNMINERYGYCRFRAPIKYFPLVEPWQWCGDYESKYEGSRDSRNK